MFQPKPVHVRATSGLGGTFTVVTWASALAAIVMNAATVRTEARSAMLLWLFTIAPVTFMTMTCDVFNDLDAFVCAADGDLPTVVTALLPDLSNGPVDVFLITPHGIGGTRGVRNRSIARQGNV